MTSRSKPPTEQQPPVNDGQGIQVIRRAGALLRALQHQPEGMSLGGLAKALSLPRSTVQRIVDALDAEGLVLASSATSGVRLGPALLSLAASTRYHVAEVARDTLKALAKETGETVDLSLGDDEKVVFIDQVTSAQRLAVASAVGVSFPLHCCSNGKAILAMLDTDELARVRRRMKLQPMTPNTITQWDRLEREIAQVRKSGIALDMEETAVGICSVAMALRSPAGEMVAISVVAPTQRFKTSEAKLKQALRVHIGRLNDKLSP